MKIKNQDKRRLFFSFLSLLRNKLYIKCSSAISYMEVQIVLVWRALPVFRLTHFSTDPYNYTTQLFYIHSKVFQLFVISNKPHYNYWIGSSGLMAENSLHCKIFRLQPISSSMTVGTDCRICFESNLWSDIRCMAVILSTNIVFTMWPKKVKSMMLGWLLITFNTKP